MRGVVFVCRSPELNRSANNVALRASLAAGGSVGAKGADSKGVSESAKQLKMDLVPVPDSTPASVGGGGGGARRG
jgi:hypothetical protein